MAVVLLGLTTASELIADHPNIADDLEQIAQEMGQQSQSQQQPIRLLQTIVEIDPATHIRSVAASISSHGGVIEATAAGLLRAWLPAGSLSTMASLEGVRYIRRPYVPQVTTGETSLDTSSIRSSNAIVSEAVALLGGTLFHSSNFLGVGVKVAIIDVGFKSLSRAIGAGELPVSLTMDARDFTNEGLETESPHGTAVAEIVHDMAPGATLFLMKIGDEVGLANAVDKCITQGIDVIVHAAGWFNTNFGDGTGVIADIAGRATRAGILWVNASGNLAQRHWIGLSRDPDHDGWIEFESNREFLQVDVLFPGSIHVFLTWDSWSGAASDLDLFLLDASGNVVGASASVQGGRESPTEELDCNVPPGSYFLKVKIRNAITPVRLEIYSINHTVYPAVQRSSIPAPGNVEEVLTVGAIAIDQWTSGPLQAYSSRGPTNDGRTKPDLMGPDNVSTFVYEKFSGTSASAPHIAGAAALILSQARSSYAGRELDSYMLFDILVNNTIDMGKEGEDSVYGSGRSSLMLQHVVAERSLRTPFAGSQITQGASFEVVINAAMPSTYLGGIMLVETLPDGMIVQAESSDATFAGTSKDGRTLTWYWPIIDPGSEIQISYKISVPLFLPAEEFSFFGTVNGAIVTGQQTVAVLPPLSISEIVAKFHPGSGTIDINSDHGISSEQLVQALNWWKGDILPPTSSALISFREMSYIVGCQLANTSIAGTSTPVQYEGTLLDTAYQVYPSICVPGEIVTIELSAVARDNLFGLGVEQNLPSGWSIVSIEANGAVFHLLETISGERAGQWLWPEIVPRGSVRTIRICARLPLQDGSFSQLPLLATWSSANPSFIQSTEQRTIDVSEEDEAASSSLMCSATSIAGQIIIHTNSEPSKQTRLRIYTLNADLIFDSGWTGQLAYQWNLHDQNGHVVANGVYLYHVGAREGSIIQFSDLEKLLVLR